jgi:hypothetical protein
MNVGTVQTEFEITHFRGMNLRVLSLIALIYGAIIFLCGAFFIALHAAQGFEHMDGLFYSEVVLAGGLAQIVYAQTTRTRLHYPMYETLGTLDNDLLFSAENKVIYKNSWFMIVLAVVATLLELILGWVSVNMIRTLPMLLSNEEPMRVVIGLLYLCSLPGALPSVIYNLRTWNMHRVIVKD